MSTERPKSKKSKRYTTDFKLKAIKKAEELGVYSTSKELGVSNSQIYKWKSQYEKDGVAGLAIKTTRPHHQPKKTSDWVVDKIVELKRGSPEMGANALSQNLKRFQSIDLSANTIAKILGKKSLPDGDAGYAEASHFVKGDKDKRLEKSVETDIGEWERFCRPNPNDLWQMDIMSFYIRDSNQIYLISAIDDCSRMIVGWGLFRQQTAENVLEVLRSALACHGAPKEVLTDQGSQFKHWKGVTQFEKLLAKLKIMHIKARSHHPQTCGKIEAFHKTIHRELIDKEFFISQDQAAERIGRFIEHYNYARPHTSLDGYAPSDRYFNVIDAVKKYLVDFKQPKNLAEEKDNKTALGRESKIYLIGKVLGKDVRVRELGGLLTVHVDSKSFLEVNLRQ